MQPGSELCQRRKNGVFVNKKIVVKFRGFVIIKAGYSSYTVS